MPRGQTTSARTRLFDRLSFYWKVLSQDSLFLKPEPTVSHVEATRERFYVRQS